MPIILHITTRADWEAALTAGSYQPASLATEGFIHGSTPAQAVSTADKYFRGRADLILLCIDEARVVADVRYEPAMPRGGAGDPRARERFPHIHGALNLDAVTATVAFPCGPHGGFALPTELAG
jgi:uncharacterized protein (DUF952 family)